MALGKQAKIITDRQAKAVLTFLETARYSNASTLRPVHRENWFLAQ